MAGRFKQGDNVVYRFVEAIAANKRAIESIVQAEVAVGLYRCETNMGITVLVREENMVPHGSPLPPEIVPVPQDVAATQANTAATQVNTDAVNAHAGTMLNNAGVVQANTEAIQADAAVVQSNVDALQANTAKLPPPPTLIPTQ
jgi:hypothetical protein